MTNTLAALAILLLPSLVYAEDSIVRFRFFGQPVTVDCSKADPGAWSVENFAHGGMRRFSKNPGFYPFCVSRNFSVRKTVGDVSFSVQNPAETVFDAEGNVESIYSMQTQGNQDLFDLKLNPALGDVPPTPAADVTFHKNGALRRFQVAHGKWGFAFHRAGGTRLLVKSLEFSTDGKLWRVVPCRHEQGSRNCK